MEITSIVYKPEEVAPDAAERYLRIPLKATALIAGHGIEGDRKGGHPKRQLNIMSLEILQGLHAEGFNTEPGQMGEQIVLRGLDVSKLVEGNRLQLGEHACVEVISHRNGCEHFERIQGKSRALTAGRLGIMAAVVIGGEIHVGDKVKMLQPDEKSMR